MDTSSNIGKCSTTPDSLIIRERGRARGRGRPGPRRFDKLTTPQEHAHDILSPDSMSNYGHILELNVILNNPGRKKQILVKVMFLAEIIDYLTALTRHSFF